MEDHVSTALRFLEHSDREFAAGDSLQGSEKIWGAVSHAVMAVAMQRGWDFGKYSARKAAVNRLAAEYGEPNLREEFFAAQQFHANFYHDFMEDDDFDWGPTDGSPFRSPLGEFGGADESSIGHAVGNLQE